MPPATVVHSADSVHASLRLVEVVSRGYGSSADSAPSEAPRADDSTFLLGFWESGQIQNASLVGCGYGVGGSGQQATKEKEGREKKVRAREDQGARFLELMTGN